MGSDSFFEIVDESVKGEGDGERGWFLIWGSVVRVKRNNMIEVFKEIFVV